MEGGTACPGRDTLVAFGTGRLPELTLYSVVRHLDSCPTCESLLLTLDASGELTVPWLQQSLPWSSLCQEPGFEELLERAKQIPLTGVEADFCGTGAVDGETAAQVFDSAPPVIEGYLISGKLGEGAFGTVWQAEDEKLQRTVTVKIPKQVHFDDAAKNAFLREARTAATLKHPNIVTVYDVQDRDAMRFIVSEYIDGCTLKQWISEQEPGFDEIARMCVQLCDALEHAHASGVIHRDLKPSNIIIDRENQPHITDFGLAKRDDSESVLTLPGQILGTPAYMSPEQASGNSHKVNALSDIYSLGVIFYELQTKQRPFHGNPSALIHRILSADFPTPRSKNKAIPRDLEKSCLTAMALDPHYRYQSAAEFRADLMRFLSGVPVIARDMPWPLRLNRLLRTKWRIHTAWIISAVPLSIFMWMIANTFLPHSGGVEVEIATEPAGAEVTFIPLDSSTGIPKPQAAVYAGEAYPVQTRIEPGRYLVVAVLNDQRFHEVFRTVPDRHTGSRQGPYNHQYWKRRDDESILLPKIVIPSASVSQGMGFYEGSERFLLGGDSKNAGHSISGKLPSFYADSKKVDRQIYEREVGLKKLPLGIRTCSAEERKLFESGEVPFAYVSWDQAVHFAELAGKRILNEVEYESAARIAVTANPQRGDWLKSPAEWTSTWAISYPDPQTNKVISSSSYHRVVRGLRRSPGFDWSGKKYRSTLSSREFVDQRQQNGDIGFRFGRSARPRLLPEDFFSPSSNTNSNGPTH